MQKLIHTVFIRIESQAFISYRLNESAVYLDLGVYFYSVYLHFKARVEWQVPVPVFPSLIAWLEAIRLTYKMV